MRKSFYILILTISALLMTSCSIFRGNVHDNVETCDSILILDNPDTITIYIVDYSRRDSLANLLKLTQDSLRQARDSVVFYRDTIKYEDYINARRIEKIKYYISICNKKPSNKKFFFGWINRAISE